MADWGFEVAVSGMILEGLHACVIFVMLHFVDELLFIEFPFEMELHTQCSLVPHCQCQRNDHDFTLEIPINPPDISPTISPQRI